MNQSHVMEAIHSILRDSAAVTALVGTNKFYARGKVDGSWPQVQFFEVAGVTNPIVDYDLITVQFTAWAYDEFTVLQIKDVLIGLFNRYSGKIALTGGTVDINWTQLIDSGASPETDLQLYGSFVRFTFKVRGTNIGGF